VKELSDKEILAAFRQADINHQNKVIKYMYVEYFPVILSYINRNNGSEEDAADVFQDALVVFYQKSRKPDFQLNCAVKTYLYSISRNTWLNRMRSRKKEVRMDEDFETVAVQDEVLDMLVENEHKNLISNLMNKLGDKCREILTLVYFERLKMDEVAERVGMSSAQVVRNQKSRCMKKLKSMIEKSDQLKKTLR